MAMLTTDEGRKAYEAVLREKEEAFQLMMYPLVVASKNATETRREMYAQQRESDLLQRRRERIAEARIDAFERGRAYVEPTPKPLLPIHNAMRRMLHADERYENKAFLPGGLLARAGDME